MAGRPLRRARLAAAAAVRRNPKWPQLKVGQHVRVKASVRSQRSDTPRVGTIAWIDEHGRVGIQPAGHPAQDWVIVYLQDIEKVSRNPAGFRSFVVEFHPAVGQVARLKQIVARWSGKLRGTTATFAAAADAEQALLQAEGWGIAGELREKRKKQKNPKPKRYAKDWDEHLYIAHRVRAGVEAGLSREEAERQERAERLEWATQAKRGGGGKEKRRNPGRVTVRKKIDRDGTPSWVIYYDGKWVRAYALRKTAQEQAVHMRRTGRVKF